MPLKPQKTKLDPRVEPYGDNAVLVAYDVLGYSEKASNAIHQLSDTLRDMNLWTNVVPAYDSLMVTFNPMMIELSSALNTVKTSLNNLSKAKKDKPIKPIDIPVFYGGEDGPDMENICKSSKLTETQIIKRHSSRLYRVCLMGFIPGFAFLSETDKKLHHPRHATPRLKVAPGSIGIANWQTGIYGLESPGGWQIIGRTPLSIFDSKRQEPFALKAGDQVRFIPQGKV
ncbi:KipI family sensor histidine kinase inhibitor [Litorimonas taeanensis]|uniref:KipI family sensor histidine kinase inhibitor n=1 Tax=Litorimonas taeanensis TaxID=568099 RepID=A0A420WM91_9PROT|nr:5-oxoprolinase subunit PxpB [Litorimonas taeanensis]RKQ72099.1 KipI family sensor histidine kinase inhibitor [Litorimonas taeanensis]